MHLRYALSDLIICGECGKPYRRATWTKSDEKGLYGDALTCRNTAANTAMNPLP